MPALRKTQNAGIMKLQKDAIFADHILKIGDNFYRIANKFLMNVDIQIV